MTTRQSRRWRQQVSWLATLFVLFASGGQICWCHMVGEGHGGHGHGVATELAHSGSDLEHEQEDEHQAEASQHGPGSDEHDGEQFEHSDSEREPHPPHGPQEEDDCPCVDNQNPAKQGPRLVDGRGHLACTILAGFNEKFFFQSKCPGVSVPPRATVPRGQAPPAFVLNCTFLC